MRILQALLTDQGEPPEGRVEVTRAGDTLEQQTGSWESQRSSWARSQIL